MPAIAMEQGGDNACQGGSAGPTGQHRCSCRAGLPAIYKRKTSWRRDWLPAIWSTVMHPRMAHFVDTWSKTSDPVRHQGLQNLPAAGPFVLALNHVHGCGPVTTLIGATLQAVSQARPDAVDEMLTLVGTRATKQPLNPLGRIGRAVWNWAKKRWSGNLLEIPMAGEKPSVRKLIAWRKAAADKPSLLFPEGIAKPLFGPVREGSASFLKALGVPVIPVAVWWQDGVFKLHFGQAIAWHAQSDLHDLQLGVRIAELLPDDMLDSDWRHLLARRRATKAK